MHTWNEICSKDHVDNYPCWQLSAWHGLWGSVQYWCLASSITTLWVHHPWPCSWTHPSWTTVGGYGDYGYVTWSCSCSWTHGALHAYGPVEDDEYITGPCLLTMDPVIQGPGVEDLWVHQLTLFMDQWGEFAKSNYFLLQKPDTRSCHLNSQCP